MEHAGDEVDVADEVEEVAVEVEAKDNQVMVSLLHWLSRGQKRLGVRCNSPQMLRLSQVGPVATVTLCARRPRVV